MTTDSQRQGNGAAAVPRGGRASRAGQGRRQLWWRVGRARRKFQELWANHGSQVGDQALRFFGDLYEVERGCAELSADERRRRRQALGVQLHGRFTGG